MERRPDPEELLKSVQEKEKSSRGQLKIFFGYAAGVGKTYAMLSAAHDLAADGVDVVLGYIEPHARPETAALTQGLEQLPWLALSYKNVTLHELDLDGAIARKPQVILVDELAHTNAWGSRHAKRYMDVEELLAQGINVYTTVNVQHLESLNDIVAAITHVQVQERIPDYIFDQADQVELVDLEPDELLERLKEGKIYQKTQAEQAQSHFFARDNLAALREIALRRMADRVNERAESDKTLSGGHYSTEEHLLICLSASPSNEKVIRTAARMANAFHGAFTALYVETPQMMEMSEADQKRLGANIKLAEQMGARVVTVQGQDLARTIAEYAAVAGVSKVVLGRSNNKRRLLGSRPNLTDRLVLLAPELDLYIIPDRQPVYDRRPQKRAAALRELSVRNWAIYGALLAAAVVVGEGFEMLGFSQSILLLFILAAFLSAYWTGSRVYAAIASVVNIFAYNFFFTRPNLTFWIHDTNDLVATFVLLTTTILTSSLTLKVKEQAKLAARQAKRTEVLLETSHKLQQTGSLTEIISAACQQYAKLLERSVVFYPVWPQGLGEAHSCLYQEQPADKLLGAEGQAVAAWVAKNGKAAGRSTDTLAGAEGLYVPVSGRDGVLGVIGIVMTHHERLRPQERGLLGAMLAETALVLEKYALNEQQKRIMLEADRERLRSNLLRAISHDFRTPLTSISGNAAVLLQENGQLDDDTRHKLTEDIYDDAQWLADLVENLLALTRVDNGEMALNQSEELLTDVVEEALTHVSRKKSEHQIVVQVEDEFLMARMDAQLIIQVIINLVNNAIKYTESGSHIWIVLRRQGAMAVVEVMDDGSGISDKDKTRLFDMFFTAGQNKGDSRRGLGLGLALCQSIIKAHHGEIYVQDHAPKGTIVGFSLPAEEETLIETDHIDC